MPNPRISIVIDNYNYGRFLKQTIDSCLAQTHPAHEIIVVDDGSTDHSREILKSYEHRPPIKIILQENQGQEAALQRGFDEATGDWILGLDSDDYYLPHCLEEIVRHIEPGVCWIYFGYHKIDERGIRLSDSTNLLPVPFEKSNTLGWISQNTFPGLPPQSFNCYDSTFVKSLRLYPNPQISQKTGVPADTYMHFMASVRSPAKAIPKALGVYRDHAAGMSKQTRHSLSGIRRSLKRAENQTRLIHELFTHSTGNIAPYDYLMANHFYYENRLISLVTEPATHPYPGDLSVKILAQAIHAIWTKASFGFAAKIFKVAKLFLIVSFPHQSLAIRRFRPKKWLGSIHRKYKYS